jgi:SAM-dependent methyltransferase
MAASILVAGIWDTVYSSDRSFFGDEPSSFAVLCYKEFEKLKVKRILELGCGQGRDTLFFAYKDIEVYTIDSSKVAVEAVSKFAIEKNLLIHATTLDARSTLPFDSNYFDAVYSHMFYNMRFTCEEIGMLFKEVNRVLKFGGLHFFSVRSDHDTFYKKGMQVTDKIYDINGFQIRFFTTDDIETFVAEGHFQLSKITEEYEDPASLYFVLCSKRQK